MPRPVSLGKLLLVVKPCTGPS